MRIIAHYLLKSAIILEKFKKMPLKSLFWTLLKIDHKNRKEICLYNGIKYFEILENYDVEIKNAYEWIENIMGK